MKAATSLFYRPGKMLPSIFCMLCGYIIEKRSSADAGDLK